MRTITETHTGKIISDTDLTLEYYLWYNLILYKIFDIINM